MNKFTNLSKINGGDFNDNILDFGNTVQPGLSMLGYITGIFYVLLFLLGIYLVIYGIKLLNTDESNWKSSEVVITKVDSTDNKTCNSTIITSSNSTKNGVNTNQRLIYNCYIHYMFNNKEIISQVINSSTNYIVGQTITVYYDTNNMNDNPILNKVFMSKFWGVFVLIGLIMMVIFGSVSYCIYFNTTCSSIFGGLFLWDALFRN